MAGTHSSERVFDVSRVRIARSEPSGAGDITLRYDGEILASFPDEPSFDKDDGTFGGLPETILLGRARVIALARGMSDAVTPPNGYPPPRRYVAPDRRTMIEFHIGFDPRDIHQQQARWRPRIFDARTGVKILDLLRIDCRWGHDWEAGGPLRLTSDALGIRISPAEGLFASSADGWRPHPIAEAQATLMRLLATWTEQDSHDGRVRRATMFDRLLWPAVAGAVALFGAAVHDGALPGLDRIMATGGVPVDGWIVRCPGADLPVMLHRTARDRLDVPIGIAPAPLARLTGRDDRYGDGKVVVELHGVNARIWPDGMTGKPLDCTGPVAG